MLEYLKHLMQLLFVPGMGWEAVENSGTQPRELDRRGFYPWLAVTCLSQFVPLCYGHGATFILMLERAIVVAGAMFASLFLAKLILDLTLSDHIEGASVNTSRVAVFCSYILGLDCLFRIIENLLPASLTFLLFLPLLCISVVFQGASYLGVRDSSLLTFTVLGTVATVIVPIGLTSLLLLFV
ncbi:MAG: hypothetical protein K2M19_02995 [Muribaculaceae bacterium]|nr:hypothetical protein [Muribaculaceae bacterium]